MNRYGLLLLAVAALLSTTLRAQPVGWAAAGGITLGGDGQHPVIVDNYDALRRALTRGDSVPQTIYVSGRIVCPMPLRVNRRSHLSLIGLSGSALVNDRYTLCHDSTGILILDRCRDVVLQNLTFVGPGAFDRDANDNLCVTRSDHVWVDHCDFQDGMDGNFDCNKGSDHLTVSWCRFRYLRQPWPKLPDDTNDDHNSDHRFSNLWGASDREGPQSEGRLRTTFDHCWWDEGCRARMPFVRFGQIHLLNCLYASSVATVYIQARYRSNVLADGCTFSPLPAGGHLFQTPSAGNAQYADYNVRFRNCAGADDLQQRCGDAPYFEPADHYAFSTELADEAAQRVRQQAGATLHITLHP